MSESAEATFITSKTFTSSSKSPAPPRPSPITPPHAAVESFISAHCLERFSSRRTSVYGSLRCAHVYGLCLLIAGSIGNLTIEKSFRGILPFFLIAVVILILTALLPGIVIGFPRLLDPDMFQ